MFRVCRDCRNRAEALGLRPEKLARWKCRSCKNNVCTHMALDKDVVTGSCVCDAPQREKKRNAQLQILELPNPPRRGGEITKAIIEKHKGFHAKSPSKVREITFGDPSEGLKTLHLMGVGECPALSWVDEFDGEEQHIDVEGEDVSWIGFRHEFRGKKPIVAFDPDSGLAYIIGKQLKSLLKHTDDIGSLGEAPVIEYYVPGSYNSIKGSFSYVHEFDSPRPEINIDNSGECITFKGGIYRISDPDEDRHAGRDKQSWFIG